MQMISIVFYVRSTELRQNRYETSYFDAKVDQNDDVLGFFHRWLEVLQSMRSTLS